MMIDGLSVERFFYRTRVPPERQVALLDRWLDGCRARVTRSGEGANPFRSTWTRLGLRAPCPGQRISGGQPLASLRPACLRRRQTGLNAVAGLHLDPVGRVLTDRGEGWGMNCVTCGQELLAHATTCAKLWCACGRQSNADGEPTVSTLPGGAASAPLGGSTSRQTLGAVGDAGRRGRTGRKSRHDAQI